MYFTDYGNYVIRKVITSTGIISTFAGIGTAGYSGDGGQATAAELDSPAGIVFDTLGNLYFADDENNVIRKIVVSTGIITTIVGIGIQGYSGDGGQASDAQLHFPLQVQIDKSNNLYIDDSNNNVIRKVITSTGIISTIVGTGYGAGTAFGGYSGDGGAATAAELADPDFIVLDSLGNLYISDLGNYVVRKVNTAGIIYTVAGNGYGAGTSYGGYSGDGGPAINAEFNQPIGLALDMHNNLYISDSRNNRVRKVSNVSSITGIEQYAGSKGQVTVYPNPASISLTLTLSKGEGIAGVYMYDVLGNEVVSTKEKEIDVSNLSNGVYFVSVKTAEGVLTKKVVVQH